MVDLLYKSRHINLSIIYILHSVKSINTEKVSFTKSFISNSNALFCFKPYGTDRSSLYRLIKSYISHESQNTRSIDYFIDQMFKVAASLSKYPYLFIQPRKDIPALQKFRTSIFDENVIFNNIGE